jgi:hypothetical protein
LLAIIAPLNINLMKTTVWRVRSHLLGLGFFFLGIVVPDAAAFDRRLWGGLEPGAHAVGFASSWQLDPARRYAPAYVDGGAGIGPAAECPRPILVYLWC